MINPVSWTNLYKGLSSLTSCVSLRVKKGFRYWHQATENPSDPASEKSELHTLPLSAQTNAQIQWCYPERERERDTVINTYP